jgi:hypothetical protein
VLLDGLNGNIAPDGQGRLTTTQLRAHLEDKLKNVAINGEAQVPKFPASDEIVLIEGLTPKRVTVNLKFSRSVHDIAVLDGGNRLAPVVPENSISTFEGRRFLLPAGKTYLIQELDIAGRPTGMMTPLIAEGEEIYVTL